MEDPVRRQRLLLETIRFPTYGLEPEWQGPRWLASLSHYEETVGIVSLAHGSRRAGVGSMIRVESWATIDPENPQTRPAKALFRLMMLVDQTSHPRATEDEHRALREHADGRVANASTGELNITVSGDAVPFSIVADGPLWAAVPTKRDFGLVVLGIDAEPSRIRLVTVDPEEYLAGSVALARERDRS